MQKSKTTTVDGQAHLQTDAVEDEYDQEEIHQDQDQDQDQDNDLNFASMQNAEEDLTSLPV